MKDWKYEAGEWTPIELPFAWNEGEDLKVTLDRAGYYDFPSETWGEDGAGLYCRRDGEPPWYINFTIADFCFSVLIYDEQSLLDWKAKYTPAYLLADIAYDIHEALGIIKKAFRAWHGHSADAVCPHCDPDAYESLQEFRQRREELRSQRK